MRMGARRVAAVLVAVLAPVASVHAERISNPIAVFSGLDKITGQTTSFEVKIGEERRFGRLLVVPRVCYSRPPTEEPQTTSFVEVKEAEQDDSKTPVFTGWMFAESPGLNAVEHPIFDVWLTACRDPNAAPVTVEAPPEVQQPTDDPEQQADD